MKINITIETSNDVDIKEAVKKANITEEQYLELCKRTWDLVLMQISAITGTAHNDTVKVIHIEKISDI